MKLQFKIRDVSVVMCGKIVRFLYDQPTNRSRVHFQCELLEQKAKNTILSYVYNIALEDNHNFSTNILDDEFKITDTENGSEKVEEDTLEPLVLNSSNINANQAEV